MNHLLFVALALSSVEPTAVSSTPGEASVYDLSSDWTNQRDERLKLATFRGRSVVLAMIYTSCRAACPLIIEDMKAIDAKLDARTRESAQFVLVSFDPKRDTPEVLRRLAADRSLDLARWTLLTGDDDGVRELAAVLGMKYRVAGGEFVHSSIITILDDTGAIRFQQSGVRRDAAESVAALSNLALPKLVPTRP